MTKIFDDPTGFADAAIDGLVAAHRNRLERVDGGVVRASEMKRNQVAVVIGGGSGHYPAFAGLVGPGLAAGSACGNLFASPSAGQIYRVAKAASTGGGVLLSYGNYAGDVLHFGQAQDRLNAEGIQTRTVVVTDDIASAPVERRHERRGIAGDLTVFKIAGAASEEGADLDEAVRLAEKANERTRSLGVAFDGCTLPGAEAPLFHVPEQSMSLGLGIHGEPGISDHQLPTSRELAELLVSQLLEERPSAAGTRVVPIVNGLGTVKYEELFVLFGHVERLLTAAGLQVVEPECGELVTSLDMSGASLTLFWVDEELERLWRAPADTPAFRRGNVATAARRTFAVADTEVLTHEAATESSAQLGQQAASLLEITRDIIVRHEAELGDLDAIAGDGDHGIGMRRGIEAALGAAQTAAGAQSVREVLAAAGEAWSEKAGGTSGALWGAGITAFGESLGNRERYGPADLAQAVEAFSDAVITLGKTDLGDKTMVDALHPYTAAIREGIEAGQPLGQILERSASTAREAALATANLRPKKGRARPLSEKSLGHQDPGAYSFALIVAGLSAQHANSTLA
ncbi:dihydroxyacetone kinase subunit L [Arthrobacter sp. MYb211]|uniref:dihydroxyacetone kinase subunit DhaL n=1 Tax=unclassified Arthrobacter TaxID=235627 RepID=UPI000CFB8138|nr:MULTISPECIES: dihydroxyacetone kinase subunit DhaL [unclassified Arthrobacter]PRA12181.1 dihydroxyacetone kinase subunit L [Arthrobacter sp. MYb221]PRC08644.1 dihydroxyacetone kinase subunit L [Arthrobacter sp. MYb211]